MAKSLKSGSKLYLSLVNSQALFITGESIKTPSKSKKTACIFSN